MQHLEIKKCDWCEAQLPNGNRFCNQACWHQWLRRSWPAERKCEWCGTEFTTHKRRKTRFCNERCSALWRNAHYPHRNFSQEERQRRREAIISLRAQPGMREKLRENIRKIRATTPKGPTVPQKMLAETLPGAVMEYALPNFMRIDLAIVHLKLAIEVDGNSHKSAPMKERDAKKEQILKERGWTLLRFWNAEILRDLPGVLNQIQMAISALEKGAESCHPPLMAS